MEFMEHLNQIQNVQKENIQKALQPQEGELRQYKDGTYRYENGKFRKLKSEEISQEAPDFSQKLIEFKNKNYPIEYEGKRMWYKDSIHKEGEEDSLSFTNSPYEGYLQETITIIEPKDFDKIKFSPPKTQGNLVQGEKVEFEWDGKKEIGWIKDFTDPNDVVIWNKDRNVIANRGGAKVKKYKEPTEQDIQKAILAKRFPEGKVETLNRYVQSFGAINFPLNILKSVKNDIRKAELQQELEEIKNKIKKLTQGYNPNLVASALARRFGIIGDAFKPIIEE